jgi:3',5'-cyclic AMP phosphodiesterase CpdA
MSVGDLIEGCTRDREQIYREWDEFNGFISRLEMPFFYVPGNHDYINDVMADIWEEKFGRSYYHFVYNDVLFLCLNSEEATKGSNMGGIEKPQYKYIKKILKENPDVRWTLVFMHQPLWILDNTRYWPDVEELLKYLI